MYRDRLYSFWLPGNPDRMYVWVKMLKSQITDSRSKTRKIGFSRGKGSGRTTRQRPAPSTRAASNSSAGTVFRPASTATAMNGNDVHTTSRVATVYICSAPVVVQLYCAQLVLPTSHVGSRDRIQSARPPSGLNSQ